MEPLREMRRKFEEQPDLVERILKEGTEKARAEAQKTLSDVRSAMKIGYS